GRSSRRRTVDEGPNERESETTVTLEDARRQKPARVGTSTDRRGEAPKESRGGEASAAGNGNERSGTSHLMEEVVGRDNMRAAWKRVKGNGGSAGAEGKTGEQL